MLQNILVGETDSYRLRDLAEDYVPDRSTFLSGYRRQPEESAVG